MSDFLRAALALLLLGVGVFLFRGGSTSAKEEGATNPPERTELAQADLADAELLDTEKTDTEKTDTEKTDTEKTAAVEDSLVEDAIEEANAALDIVPVDGEMTADEDAETVATGTARSSLLWWAKLALFLLLMFWLLWWLIRWLSSSRTSGATGSIAADGNDRIDAELGRVFTKRPSHTDKLADLNGIDAAMEKRLNAAGIYQFDQLRSLTRGQQQALTRKFGLGGFNFQQLHSPEFNSARPNATAAQPTQDADLGFVYKSAPKNVDDLTKLEGITPEIAGRLNRAGIYKFDQLKNLSADQFAAVKKRCHLPDLETSGWKKWIPGFAGLGAAIGAGGAALGSLGSGAASGAAKAASGTASNLTSSATDGIKAAGAGIGAAGSAAADKVDASLGPIFTSKPADADDLSKLEGITPEIAAKLNGAGIYKFDQLKNLSTDQFAALKSRCGLPDIDMSGWKKWIPGFAGIGGAIGAGGAALGSLGSGAASGAAKAVSGTASNLTSSATDGIKAAGAGIGAAGSAAADKVDASIGPVFMSKPANSDDLSKLDGITPDIAAKLNRAGIYKFDQLKNLSADQFAALKAKCDLPDIDSSGWKKWIPGFAGLGAGVAGTAAAIGGGLKGAAGQAASATGDAAANLASNTASNVSAAASASVNLGSSSTPTPSGGTHSDDDSFNSDWDKAATRIDLDFGEVFINPPTQTHDFTKLPGVDQAVAAKMNAAGIYRMEQLRSLSPRQKASFKRRFGVTFGDWDSIIDGSVDGGSLGGTTNQPSGTGQGDGRRPIGFRPGSAATSAAAAAGGIAGAGAAAAGMAAGKTDKTVDKLRASVHTPGPGERKPDFGFAYKTPPAERDDLTKLAGIDQAAARKLNDAGIYTYAQIDAMDQRQQSALASHLGLDIDFADWKRCVYAWGRGIATTADVDSKLPDGQLHGVRLAQVAHGVFDGEKLVAYPEQVIFRGENPEQWGKNINDGTNRAVPIHEIRNDINYVRVRRADTRESVVLPITKSQLFANGDPNTTGWNGSAEMFYGGRHIGVFAEELPQEVETKFSQGGWGFGHRFDHNDRQEWGWEGRVIPPTTFEISVGRIGQAAGTVVFRGSDAAIWNTRTREGDHRFADPLSGVGHTVNFVRIQRTDTGEAVIVQIEPGSILKDNGGGMRSVGWNGSNNEFSGGHHLGAFKVDLPQEAETRFGDGGWGFGHPYNDNDRQAWCWAGRALPETVFEISVLEFVPANLRDELLIG